MTLKFQRDKVLKGKAIFNPNYQLSFKITFFINIDIYH